MGIKTKLSHRWFSIAVISGIANFVWGYHIGQKDAQDTHRIYAPRIYRKI